MINRAVIDLASRRHGVISLEEWLELGLNRRSWYWAISSGALVRLHPRVARLPGAPVTPEQMILAAVLACGPGARASHRSAAHLWVPAEPPSAVDVMVPRANGIELEGVCIHRPTDLGDLRMSFRQSIPVTNPLRTLVDLGAVDPDGVRPFFERLVIAALVTPAAAAAVLARHEKCGRPGPPALRAVLADWTMNAKPPDSVLEETMNALVLRHRLPPVKFHPRIIGYEPDFIVLDSPVLIECDGWETHGLQRNTFESDRVRDNALTAAGYVVTRFTWRRIKRRPASVAADLRAVIARHAPHLVSWS